MTPGTVIAGWALVALLVGLSVALDHFRMLTSHFNWFMAIQFGAVAIVVVIVLRLARAARRTPAATDPTPAETGGEET